MDQSFRQDRYTFYIICHSFLKYQHFHALNTVPLFLSLSLQSVYYFKNFVIIFAICHSLHFLLLFPSLNIFIYCHSLHHNTLHLSTF
jgi:hypothetical protein